MHVNSVRHLEATDQLLTPQAQGSPSSGVVGSSTTANISNFASTLSNLQQLQQSDPTQFEQVMANAASLLASTGSGTGSPGTQLLSQLANQFQVAAQEDETSPDEAASSEQPNSSKTSAAVHRGVQSYAAQQSWSASDAAQQSSNSLSQIVQSAMQQATV